jgi:hypothetical protein
MLAPEQWLGSLVALINQVLAVGFSRLLVNDFIAICISA